MNYLCDKKSNFQSTDISFLPGEKTWLEEEVVKNGIKRFHQTGLVSYYMVSRMKKKGKHAPCPIDIVLHLHCPMPTGAPTSAKIYVQNQDV